MPNVAIASAYCDGGVIGANPSEQGGAWAWAHVTPDGIVYDKSSGLLIPNGNWPQITNNYAEYIAAIRCLRALPTGWAGTLYLDSEVTMGRLVSDWPRRGIPDKIQTLADRVLSRMGAFKCVLVAGHPTQAELQQGWARDGRPISHHNVMVDDMCTRTMRDYLARVNKIRRQQATGATESLAEPQTLEALYPDEDEAEVRF